MTLAFPLLLLLAAGPASAQETPKLRVAVPAFEADLAAQELAAPFGATLRGLADGREGWRVTDPGILSVSEAKLSFSCLGEDPACWSEVGSVLEADLLLIGTVRSVPAGVSVTLLLFDIRGVRLMDRLVRTLPRQGAVEVFTAAVRSFLFPDAVSEPGVLRIVCEPDGGEVLVDGVSVGLSPVPDVSVEPGVHEVVVALAGHHPWRRRLEAQAGAAVDLRVSLTRLPPPTPAQVAVARPKPVPPTPRSRFRSWLGWGVLGGGAVVGGIGLLFGKLASDAHDEFAQNDVPQRRAYDLRDDGERHARVANVLFGVGAALATTGVVLAASAPSDPEETAVSAALSPAGVSLGVRF